ncbi:unnamed protein product [Symbiodinium sp. KB8]|nr:unnamed protein product [Symbiodinium sp. KB8]
MDLCALRSQALQPLAVTLGIQPGTSSAFAVVPAKRSVSEVLRDDGYIGQGHNCSFEAFDKKVLDLATHSPADASLRTVTTTELVAADRKLWQEIASLHSTGWSLDDALHEMTTVRADIGNLLQYRAKPPPPPQKPPPRKEGKGKDGKGGGKTKNGTQPGKRKEPGTGTAPEVKTSDLVKEHGGATVIVKWAGGRCRDGPLVQQPPADCPPAPQTPPTSVAEQRGPAHDTCSSAEQHPSVSNATPGKPACASRPHDAHATPQPDTASSEYSSDDSELPGEALHFFLQISAERFFLPLRDLDPMHCLEAEKTAAQSLVEPATLAQNNTVGFKRCSAQRTCKEHMWVSFSSTPALHSLKTAIFNYAKSWPRTAIGRQHLQMTPRPASFAARTPSLAKLRNWTAAEQSPELLAQLIQQEVEKGFVKRFEGTEEDAALHWPKGTAIGKLNVVVAEGRDPRLVLDSTVCGLNPAVHIPERVALPTASDVQRTFLAEAFYDCLDATGQLSRTPTGSWLPRHGRVLEARLTYARKASLSWNGSDTALRTSPRSLRAAPLLHCLSAADAFADKHRMGIGGWLTTSRRYFWYSEIFTAEQVRQQWPQLSGSLQPYIGCFEALAQLALAQCVWQALRSKHVRFVLPSASDNTSAESGLNKLFSTAEPLGTFLRLAATWAHLHRVQFQVEHLAGEKNVWADKLSRGSTDFMQRRSADRVRVTLSQLASASHSVSLHGSATHWPKTLVQAQHEMLK